MRTAPDATAAPAEVATARRLRVVHVITTLTTGGAETQLELLATHTRHDATVVALYGGGPVAATMTAAGVDVRVLGSAGRRRFLTPLRLVRLLRRLRPDVVHVHLLSAQLWGIPAARMAGVPVVVSSEHSLMDDSIEGRPLTAWLRVLYRLLERMATRTVAVSPATARRLRAWGVPPRRTVVIGNGLDLERIRREAGGSRRDVRPELAIPPDAPVAVIVGRLDPVKRVDAVLRALAAQVRDAGLHLLLVGDGPLRADLTRLAAELGVSAGVHLTGPRSDVARLLGAADVLVSASRDETFGLAVLEALVAGLPVAYAQCPAVDDLDEPPACSVRLPVDAGAAAEQTAISAAVLDLLARWRGPHPVPAALAARYSIATTAAALDALYDGLVVGPGR